MALAVAEPADPRRQALELHALARQLDPARGCGPARRTARGSPRRSPRCRPGRRTARPSGTAPCPRRTAAGCRRGRSRGRRTRRRRRAPRPRRAARCRSRTPRRPAACSVADRGDVGEHATRRRGARYSSGSLAAQHVRLLDRQPGGDVAVERVVRARLVGHDVDRRRRAATSSGSTSAALPSRPIDSARPSACAPRRAAPARRRASRRARPGSRSRSGARCACRSTSTHSAQPSFIVTASGCAPPIPPSPAVTTSRPFSVPPKRLRADRGERLVGALQDPLGPDVDPGPGGHLAVHHQPGGVELAELVPVAQCGTRLELAISTRGASAWVSNTPTGLPDCTSSVSWSPSIAAARA